MNELFRLIYLNFNFLISSLLIVFSLLSSTFIYFTVLFLSHRPLLYILPYPFHHVTLDSLLLLSSFSFFVISFCYHFLIMGRSFFFQLIFVSPQVFPDLHRQGEYVHIGSFPSVVPQSSRVSSWTVSILHAQTGHQRYSRGNTFTEQTHTLTKYFISTFPSHVQQVKPKISQ